MALQSLQRVDKPWGYELIWARTHGYAAKILHIKGGHKLSLQYHRQKEETIYLQSGRMILVIENDHGELCDVELSVGQAHHVAVGRRHRMIAIEDTVDRVIAVLRGRIADGSAIAAARR